MRSDPRLAANEPTALARSLRGFLARQGKEVRARLGAGLPKAAPDLSYWTAPMVEALSPLVAAHLAAGGEWAAGRLGKVLEAIRDERQPGRRSNHEGARPADGLRPADGRDGRGRPGREVRGVPQGQGRAVGGPAGGVAGGLHLRGAGRDGLRLHRRHPAAARAGLLRADGGLPFPSSVFDATHPKVAEAVRRQTFDFCDATNATSTLRLQEALDRLRQELLEGLEEGEAVGKLAGRVQTIFDDPARAYTIARTEASRAVHAGQQMAAEDSGIVGGKRWLAKDDACPECLALAEAGEVGLADSFFDDGGGDTYSVTDYPPLHPHCTCTMGEVLDDQFSRYAALLGL